MTRPKIRVIMMSAHWTEKTRETARKLGALAILSKPFPMDELLEILKRV